MVDEFSLAADLLDPPLGGVGGWFWDLGGFVRECFRFPSGEGAAAYQLVAAERLCLGGRVGGVGRLCVRGPHGLGKTAFAAWAVLWFALTRDAAGVPWKVVTTASAWRQLERYLWPEVRLWAGRLRWGVVGREPFRGDELLTLSLRLRFGEAFAVASDDPATIEGAHADAIFYLYDEAKRLDVATPLPTPSGWTTMGDVRVGDLVLDELGCPTRVTYVSPVVSGRPCQLVRFSDGAEIVADDGHLWSALSERKRQIRGQTHRNDPRYKRVYEPVRDWREHWDLAETLTTVEMGSRSPRMAIPTCRSLQMPHADLPIDPYTLGAWLGDGLSSNGSIVTMDKQILDHVAAAGYEPKPHATLCGRARVYGLMGLRRDLRLNGLLGNKHIPRAYLRASHEQRLALLRGLMDTDGTNMGGARVSFCSTRHELAEGVAELVRSLGHKVRLWEGVARYDGIETGPVYILRWSAEECPFMLRRKADKWAPRSAQASRCTIRTVVSVEPTESVPTRCIAVDSPRHLYLAGRDFVPTHNTIPGETFDASEGAFSGAGGGSGRHALALASSTPGVPEGRFFEIQDRRPGFEDWDVLAVSFEETVEAGRNSVEWAEARARQWGERSAVFLNRVRGEFASSEEDCVVELGWVEAANARWQVLEDEGGEWGFLSGVGVDVARSGRDETVLALRHGLCVSRLLTSRRGDLMETAGLVVAELQGRERHPEAVVDVIGIGAGVVDRLREQGFPVVAFNASESTDMTDRSGELRMLNCRSAAYWNLRDLLDPAYGSSVALPPDALLIGDLCAPKWRMSSSGRVQVEAKDDIRARLGRSPDRGDAVMHAFWTQRQRVVSAPVFVGGKSRWQPVRDRLVS